MKKPKKVKSCFGHYGEKEEKDCREDCRNCPELESLNEIIFCPKKKAYPCDTRCNDVNLCRRCYWRWWDKNRDRRCSLMNEIRKFMADNKLVFDKRRGN